AERGEDAVPLEAGGLLKACGELVEQFVGLREAGLGDLFLDGGPEEWRVEVVRLLAAKVPEEARASARVVMQDQLGVVEVRFARDGTHADAADVFDAALLDEVRDNGKDAVEVLAVIGLDVGYRVKEAAPSADLPGNASEPLLGAEVEVQVAARVEFGGDLGEAGAFGGGRHGWGGCLRLGRRGLLLFAAGDGEEGEQDEGQNGANRGEAFHG